MVQSYLISSRLRPHLSPFPARALARKLACLLACLLILSRRRRDSLADGLSEPTDLVLRADIDDEPIATIPIETNRGVLIALVRHRLSNVSLRLLLLKHKLVHSSCRRVCAISTDLRRAVEVTQRAIRARVYEYEKRGKKTKRSEASDDGKARKSRIESFRRMKTFQLSN